VSAAAVNRYTPAIENRYTGLRPWRLFSERRRVLRRASYVEFVGDMKVETLIGCQERALAVVGSVPKSILHGNLKTAILEHEAYGEGKRRFHAGVLEFG
jgi:hypothetical protein